MGKFNFFVSINTYLDVKAALRPLNYFVDSICITYTLKKYISTRRPKYCRCRLQTIV